VEGELWPEDVCLGKISIVAGVASLDQIESVQAYVGKLRRIYPDSVIDCIRCKTDPTGAEGNSLDVFLGYDFGYLESVTNVYSTVYNEVVYGKYSGLRAMATKLNAQLLLPTMKDVSSLRQMREDLLRSKADLESDQECVAIAVFDPDLA